MTQRSVLFIDGSPLYIQKSIKRKDGALNAWVINGAWNLRIKGNTAYAKSGRCIVNKWEFTTLEEVEVPDDMQFMYCYSDYGENYNAAIEWAEGQRKEDVQ